MMMTMMIIMMIMIVIIVIIITIIEGKINHKTTITTIYLLNYRFISVSLLLLLLLPHTSVGSLLLLSAGSSGRGASRGPLALGGAGVLP